METNLNYNNKVKGFKDVLETVKSKEKISASSFHFLEMETANLNQYTDFIERILARLSLFYQKKDHPFLQQRKTGEKMLIIITADKGLVGGLWHKVINTFLEKIGDYYTGKRNRIAPIVVIQLIRIRPTVQRKRESMRVSRLTRTPSIYSFRR